MRSAKIMIVEDNTTVAKDLCDCLESLGYVVTSIEASGEESIEKADAERPDAVLMDIYLRDKMDGIETAGQIHERFNIPVIFLSAYGDRELLQRAKHVGSFGYLIKPFEERELYATLEMVLYKAKANKAMLAASRMEATATLAGGIAHDYNNLMFVVLGNAELVRESLAQDDPNTKLLKQIETAAQQASELAQRLLAYARGGAYRVEKLNLNDVVHKALQEQSQNIPRQINITCNTSSDLWPIKADQPQIEMILASLCANAVEAIKGEGNIQIATRNISIDDAFSKKHKGLKPGDYVALIVEDTGCGMNDVVCKKAFEPFFTTKFQGRGLGLAAVYGIVKNHGGYFMIESKEKEGATCAIYFPAVEIKAKQAPVPSTAKPEGKETVLVVDDEEQIRMLISAILKRYGYQVLTASGGQAAVDLAREYKGEIHLALLDMGMPIMDGPATFPLLRKARPKMKILIFSGYEQDVTTQSLLDAGACGCLKKPVLAKTLSEKVREVLTSRAD